MEENKYQVIDPMNDNYKLTAEDLRKDKKRYKKNGKKKRRGLRILVSLLVVFAILAGGVGFFVNSYLDKINYGDSAGDTDPNLAADENLTFEGQDEADKNIRDNLDDSVMWYDDRVYNILLVGVDYGQQDNGKYRPRSDSNILVSINTVNNTINMVSLSRASYVYIEGVGNRRLNVAHAAGGAALVVDTVQKNYKVRIDNYVVVDISGFEQIIDVLGGVTITMTAQEASVVVGKAVEGTYELNGEQAVSYSRVRYFDSDRKRTGRQRAVLEAIFNKFKGSSVSTLLGLMDDILPLVTTDFSKAELISQVTKAPKYLSMSLHQDIIPYKALPLTVRDDIEVLILDWDDEVNYLHDLIYADIIPQSAKIG